MEKWKDIKGYEGLYLISSLGRVLSLRRYRKNGKGGYYTETKILKPSKTSTGYKKYELNNDGKRETFKAHRLVALHFVANPYKKKYVNHKDGNKINNAYNNLEWVNHGENVIHSVEIGLKDSFNIDKKSLEYLYIDKNLSPNEIGKIFGITRGPIDFLIEEYGIAKKEIVTKYQINEEDLLKKIKQGKTNAEIAKEYDCTQSLISHYKKRLKERGEIYG